MVDIGFISGAQIDEYGNINSTVIGEYNKPEVRLPGSGGACTIASSAKKLIVIMPHEKRRFIEKVDFITSPGYLNGEREEIGLIGGGPTVVITDMGVLKFDLDTKEMYLHSVHPGVTVEKVKENTDWDLKISDQLNTTPSPTRKELKILREELDPKGIFLGRR